MNYERRYPETDGDYYPESGDVSGGLVERGQAG